MIAADSGNGVAVVLDPRRFTFVNADLTVYVHRLPEGEWVCLEAVTAPEPTGIGLTTSRLFDRRGPIGWSLQGLVVQTREEASDVGRLAPDANCHRPFAIPDARADPTTTEVSMDTHFRRRARRLI